MQPRFFAALAFAVLSWTWTAVSYAVTPATANDLSWLSGEWQSTQQGVTSEAHYSTPAAGSVLGILRITAGAQLAFYEYERIAEENGTLILYPVPNGNVGVSFSLVHLETKSATFENPTHAFPRTVQFAVDDTNNLHIYIDGTQNGQPAHQEMIMQRQ